MRGFIDLHCHPVPGVDDGVRSVDAGVELLAGLHRAGFDRVVATPHIRSGLWENRRASLEGPFGQLTAGVAQARAAGRALPAVELAAEHLFDDVVWELFAAGQAMPYPGGRSALVEFSYDSIPVRVELRLWKLKKSGITPVLAHPERYAPLFRSSERLEELIGAGVKPLLDVMSLVGAYGRSPQLAAERMLKARMYAAACSDAHKPADVELVAEAVSLLQRIAGNDETHRLLIVGPRELLAGREA
jgi:protein-tyrosine phosphatase